MTLPEDEGMVNDIVTEDFHVLCCSLVLPPRLSWRGKAFGNGSVMVPGLRHRVLDPQTASKKSEEGWGEVMFEELIGINANRCLASYRSFYLFYRITE